MAVTDQQVFQWFQDNPGATDAQIAQAAAAAGVSASQLSRVTGVPVSEVVSRVEATGLTIQPNDYSQAYVDQLVKEAAAQAGGTLSYEDAVRAATNLGIPSSLLQDSIASGLITAAPTTTTTSDAPTLFGNLANVATNWGGGNTPIPLNDPIVHIANQILSQGLTSKWTGEGAGSPEANALYMADTLRKAGITDISQFGEIKQTVQGEPIYGEDRYIIGYGPDKVITTYGNKETGQVLPNTYGERQTGNAWGGTYAGEGNTAYRVQFDASGNPVFYTTEASSNTLAGLLDDPILNIAANVAASVFGGPAGVAALQLAQGKSLKDAAKAAALAYAGGELSKALNAGVTDPSALSAAADADMAAGMLPEYGTNAAYDQAMADLMANSPGAVVQMQNIVNDVTGVNADIAGGLIPDYGITYDQVMADLMAQSPGATEQLENIVNSQVGGTLGPDNIDVGGGWNPADTTDFSMEVTASRPEATYHEASYSNEGLNYPGTATTIGSGGSPVNASTSTTTPSLNDVLNVVKAGTAVAGLVGGASALNQQPTGFEIVPVPSDWKSPTYGQTGQWPALTPIDFGSRELLRGTQWEKYINPAQPVTPVPAPTGMNYGQLMNVLQGGQGGTLSLNNIISGIQSQYGQTNTGTVGQ